MEPNSPKKIQFAVPLFQSQIAPEAAEQIRKRRPTPASLVILNEHNPPEIDDKRVTNTQAEVSFLLFCVKYMSNPIS
ncbi:protein phosphatase 1 regulatory subunit 1C [Bos javanicus]|uniref:protein phosphatase 1 regulatory subunit 1C n=1 Tax=Bos javanicus TaxID=9906 RepID=UPI002AA74326|nr:protein phosphatase 1 regulatory subunit 1C [Bos javanicus]